MAATHGTALAISVAMAALAPATGFTRYLPHRRAKVETMGRLWEGRVAGHAWVLAMARPRSGVRLDAGDDALLVSGDYLLMCLTLNHMARQLARVRRRLGPQLRRRSGTTLSGGVPLDRPPNHATEGISSKVMEG